MLMLLVGSMNKNLEIKMITTNFTLLHFHIKLEKEKIL